MKNKLTYILLSIATLFLLYAAYFFTIKYLDKKILGSTDVFMSAKNKQIPNYIIPTDFIDGERFYIKLPIADNDTIMAFGDTGGGISFITPKTLNKQAIKSNLRYGILKGIMPLQYILYKDLVKDINFPIPYLNKNLIIRNPFRRVTSPFLMIPPLDDELKFMLEAQPEMDVFLGQTFFMGHSWTLDYPNEQIMVNTPLHDSLVNQPNIQKLGFKKNANQEKLFGHPSMTVIIERDTIDVLFDTGASMVLSEEGKKLLYIDKKTSGGSFIAASIFNKWRKEHPEWKHYPKADLAGDVIEVPIVNINGHEIGPVLFAMRQDKVWSEGMIKSMDKVVKGAIGGTALKFFKITIDYNSELIKFEK
ncbi:MAG: hypothetical protein HOP11_11430 [Saprospiraceae bacterium]|nr:hypothetical protein [Saprospiraceae bacterium]